MEPNRKRVLFNGIPIRTNYQSDRKRFIQALSIIEEEYGPIKREGFAFIAPTDDFDGYHCFVPFYSTDVARRVQADFNGVTYEGSRLRTSLASEPNHAAAHRIVENQLNNNNNNNALTFLERWRSTGRGRRTDITATVATPHRSTIRGNSEDQSTPANGSMFSDRTRTAPNSTSTAPNNNSTAPNNNSTASSGTSTAISRFSNFSSLIEEEQSTNQSANQLDTILQAIKELQKSQQHIQTRLANIENTQHAIIGRLDGFATGTAMHSLFKAQCQVCIEQLYNKPRENILVYDCGHFICSECVQISRDRRFQAHTKCGMCSISSTPHQFFG